MFWFSHPAISQVYFCEDTIGDISHLNRQFLLSVEDEVMSMAFIKKGKQISPKTEDRIIYKTSNSLVAVNDSYDVGVATFSMHKGQNSAWKAIRTYVEEDYSFSQKSDCFVQ